MRGKGVSLRRERCGRVIKDWILEHRRAQEQIREHGFYSLGTRPWYNTRELGGRGDAWN
jgi:hypothetical protein